MNRNDVQSVRRVIGCCNYLDELSLTPHDVGGYIASRLIRHPNLPDCAFFYPQNGINNALIEAKIKENDLVLIDDVNLDIGNLKILRLTRYGKRGHNAVKTYLKYVENRSYRMSDPIMILLGVGPVKLSQINDKFEPKNQNRFKMFGVALYRGMFAWPNQSHVIQITKDFFRIYLKSFS